MTDTAPPRSPAERRSAATRLLTGEDGDERACAAIGESACTDLPRNTLLNVANGAATKLAEQLASPTLVLPWLLAGIGAPATLAALLVPVKQAGSLLPQLAVAGRIRGVARRKWVWVAAGLIQALMLTVIGTGVLVLPPELAGSLAVLAFAVFSMASGAGSVAFQDVLGKTVPAGRRGRLLAHRALSGGALTLAAGLALQPLADQPHPEQVAVPLIVAAALLWTLGAGAFAAIREEPGATEGGRTMWHELGAGLALARSQLGYRRFLVARALLLSAELAVPFYALRAAALHGAQVSQLGSYLLALGAAHLVATPFWGRWSDASSRTVLTCAGALAAVAGALALVPQAPPWLLAGVFLLSGVAEAGLRLGRKTYLVDAAPAAERALYAAFSNTAVGVLALAGVLFGLLADFTAPAAAIAALTALTAAGAVASWRLPEVGPRT